MTHSASRLASGTAYYATGAYDSIKSYIFKSEDEPSDYEKFSSSRSDLFSTQWDRRDKTAYFRAQVVYDALDIHF